MWRLRALPTSQNSEAEEKSFCAGDVADHVSILAVNDLVADRCPTQFAAQGDVQAVLAKQTKFLRHHQRRAIGERHEAHTQRTLRRYRRSRLNLSNHN